jgi:NADH-quinone oxidoreductase subunit J
MVLFLFVIMILDLKSEERRRLKGLTAKILFVLGLGAVSTITIAFFQSVKATGLKTQVERGLDGSTFELGRLLFTHYLLPFEIVSILLLVAMVGVILLSKKDLK